MSPSPHLKGGFCQQPGQLIQSVGETPTEVFGFAPWQFLFSGTFSGSGNGNPLELMFAKQRTSCKDTRGPNRAAQLQKVRGQKAMCCKEPRRLLPLALSPLPSLRRFHSLFPAADCFSPLLSPRERKMPLPRTPRLTQALLPSLKALFGSTQALLSLTEAGHSLSLSPRGSFHS